MSENTIWVPGYTQALSQYNQQQYQSMYRLPHSYYSTTSSNTNQNALYQAQYKIEKYTHDNTKKYNNKIIKGEEKLCLCSSLLWKR